MVPPPIPQLLAPAAEVRELLRGRIELGKQQSVQAERALAQDMARLADHLEGEFRKWDRYNEVLLRRCFSDDGTSEAYRHAKPIIMTHGPADKVRAIVRRYQGAIDELEATVEILELLDEADGTPPVASTQGHRDDYFARLCEHTGGRPDQIVDSREVAAGLGLDDATRSDVEDFLRAEGLIEFLAMGPQVALTHAGRLRCESGGKASTAVPIQQGVTIMGDMIGGTIQQAGHGSQQAATTSNVFDSARTWVEELESRFADNTLVFADTLHAEVEDHLSALKEELASPSPRRNAVRSGLRALQRVMENAGGNVVAAGLLQALPPIIDALT